MDIRTGKTYGTFDDAIADGVPESDIANVRLKGTRREPYPTFTNPKHPEPHQGARELARNLKRIAARA